MRTPAEVNDRYQLFLTDVATSRIIYTAIGDDESFAAWSYDENQEPLVLFWSKPEFVKEAIESQYNGYELCEIAIEDFGDILNDLQKQNYFIAINWYPEMIGLEVSPSALFEEIVKTS